MNEGRVTGQPQLIGWKVWASAFAGALIAFVIGKLSGAGSDEIFHRPGQDVGFAAGYGLGIGLLVWLAFRLTTLRDSGWLGKFPVFLVIAVGGTLGVMHNI